MKKLLLFITILLFGITSSYASHLMGGEITYKHISGNDYEVTLIVYNDCGGSTTTGTGTLQVNFQSATCGLNFTEPIEWFETNDVSQVCPGQTTTCNGGTVAGTQQFVYRDTVTLIPCTDWIINWNQGNRNGTINNLVNPTGTNLYLQTTLDNVVGAFNNSPQFLNIPTPYLCINQLAIYSHAASDIDGDSLYYSFNTPLTTPGPPGVPIPFATGYSLLQPMTTTAGMNLNQQTGEMCFTPDQVQTAVVSVIITEFRQGILIGTQIREMQVIVDATCTNQNPTTGTMATCGGSGGMTITVAGPSVDSLDQNSIRMCPDDNLCLQITFSDPDLLDSITVIDNIATAIPGATWSVLNNNTESPIGTFCWTPTALDSGINVFSLILKDDACPISGTQTFTYDITVFDQPYAGPDQIICGTQAAQLNASGGATYTWFDAATNLQVPVGPAFSCNPCFNPLALPTITTDYYVLSSLTAACENTDTVKVIVVPDFTPDAIGDTTLCDFLTRQLDVNILTGPAGTYTYLWNNTATLSNINIKNPIASPQDSTWYVVEVTSPDGCAKTVDSVLVGVVAPAAVELTPGNHTLCLGDTVNFDVSLIAISDDFNGGFDPAMWSSVQGGATNAACGTMSGDALYFSGTTRELITNSLATTNCTSIDFCLFIGNIGSGFTCENADLGEDVNLSYSINGGTSWINIQTFLESAWDANNNWQCFNIAIPAGAQTNATLFKWDQPANSGANSDVWAIDDLNISCGGNTTYDYLWSPAADLSNPAISNPVYTSTTTGTTTFTVTLTDPGSGCSFSRTQDITVNSDTLNLSLLPDTTLCEGSFVTILSDPGFVSYQWAPSGGSSQSGVFIQPGNYTLTVSDGVCYETSNTLTVSEIPKPLPEILGVTEVCANDSTTLSVANLYDSYLWSTTETQTSITVASSILAVTLTVDSASCSNTVSTLITELPVPVTTILGVDSICSGASINLGTSNGPFDSFVWNPNNSTDSSITTNSGTVSVTVALGICEYTTDTTIYNYPTPVADFTITPETSGEPNVEILFTNTSTGASSWVWDFDVTNISSTPSNETGFGPFNFIYENQGTYSVTLIATDDHGCFNTTNKEYLIFSEIGTPNIITPNGDDKNDFLVFKNLDPTLFPNHITVLNRWGGQVFDQANYNNDWNGDNLNEGTYFYILKVQFNSGERVLKGSLTLLK